ncbi:MAG TPA: SUMF1/EgtB/PvdO family nonheme iron enzyme [Prosthecobacter sp.]|nr:SUMF1/EgtB/PvdO family nonheme iron enzyme [Prosthecobacter sp.]
MTLLFLDSNAATRGPRTEALKAHPGWTVKSVPNVAEALAWLGSATRLDLLITEAVVDATSTGFELRDRALAKFPQARVLFTTRYDLSGFEDRIAGWTVLPDAPFSPEKLVQKARAALGATPPPSIVPQPPHLDPGTMLGQYQVMERLTVEPESETYRAIQVTVQRPVALVLLRPDLLGQADAVADFKARERLKASISHPRIAPLYEASSAGGLIFYTREMPRGRPLEDILAAGEHYSERKIAEILFGVAEAMHHGVSRGHHHRRLMARDIFVDSENQASIVNLFRPGGSRPRVPEEEVRALLELVSPLAAEGKARGLISGLIEKNHDWAGLLEDLDDVREAMRERSIMRRIEAEESQVAADRNIPWWGWALVVGAVILVFVLGSELGKNGVGARNFVLEPEMVRIPAGRFIFQNGARRNLPDYWISRHEVTIGQYADFIAAIGGGTALDHPSQPKTKTGHTPPKWAEILAAAKAGATYNGQPISLNTPVTQVDWWDAYAYARWRGQRLPTEEEWEKAARGEDGRRLPWGAKPLKGAANLGEDYDANGKGGKVDGHVFWAPVDRQTQDISPFGIHDMAGNVSEWTASERAGETWPAHPDYPDLRVPVVRGGHFALKNTTDLLTTRFFAESPDEATLTRGFRTAADK